MDNLTTLPNLGKTLDGLLKQAGINTISELKNLGCEQTFIRLRAIDSGACLHKLYAIEGAINDIPKKDISTERKEELRYFFEMLTK